MSIDELTIHLIIVTLHLNWDFLTHNCDVISHIVVLNLTLFLYLIIVTFYLTLPLFLS